MLTAAFIAAVIPAFTSAGETKPVTSSNFGLPGIVDLQTARRFPDGELIVTQQLHKSLARSGISFQALPRVGVSFRYTGHGVNGREAYGRINHDRSFDAHISIINGEYTYQQFPSGLEILLGQAGIPLSILLAPSRLEMLNHGRSWFGRWQGEMPFQIL